MRCCEGCLFIWLRSFARQEDGTYLAGPSRMTWRPAGSRRTPPQTKASSRMRHFTTAGMSGICLRLASSSRSEMACMLVTGMYARTRVPLYAGCVLWMVYIVYRAPACMHQIYTGQEHFGIFKIILRNFQFSAENNTLCNNRQCHRGVKFSGHVLSWWPALAW